MRSIKISNDVYWVGVKDPNLRTFDIVMHTEFGTTYNSYLVKGDKVAVIDGSKEYCGSSYLESIREIIPPENVDYLIVNHNEPDHAGAIEQLLDINPKIKIVTNSRSQMFLKDIINREADYIIVDEKSTLDLGNGCVLSFVMAPFLHWPDTMFTYLEKEGILFTCDAFGFHYCDERMFDDEVMDFDHHFKYYYDVIMSPFKGKILEAIKKIEPLNIKMIAPSHGLIHRKKPMDRIAQYREWSQPEPEREKPNVLILYVSAYGYTKALAETIFSEVLDFGFDATCLDITCHDISEIIEKVNNADVLFIGSPTLNQNLLKPVSDVLAEICPIINRGKLAGAFGSFGWSGEAVPMIEERLKSLKFKLIESGFKVRLKPTPADLESVRTFCLNTINGCK